MKNVKAILLLFLFPIYSFAGAVKVQPDTKGWILNVDGKPFYVKGAGCGLAVGRDGVDYLKLAKELGANTVRTWGVDQGNKEYLDKASQYGLRVDAGIWVEWPNENSGISYIGNEELKQRMRSTAMAYVHEFKNHPAILMWNVGNEALFFASNPEEKVALAQFIEELVRDVKKEDPQHPILYTAASSSEFSLLKEYVPSLDIMGVNVYGSVGTVQSVWTSLGFNKPYLITEFGGRLPNDTQKDINHMPSELRDQDKAMIYRNLARDIVRFKGSNLGGFVFHLGDTSQDSLTWWNITLGTFKKAAFWEIFKIYTGQEPPSISPRIRSMSLSKIKDLVSGETIDISLEIEEGAVDPKFEFILSTAKTNLFLHYPNDPIPLEIVSQEKGVAKVRVPHDTGVYRLYGIVKDKFNNAASISKTISVQ